MNITKHLSTSHTLLFLLVMLVSTGVAPAAEGTGTNRSYCIDFVPSTSDVGFMTNYCSWDLDVTWCHSDSQTTCTDAWKSSGVEAQGQSTVSYDRDDRNRTFKLIYACDRHASRCLEARNKYKNDRSR